MFDSLIERIIALIIFILLLPLLIIIYTLVMLDSKGNPIFTQLRIGKNGKHYKMYKFRSMTVHKVKGFSCVYNSDSRITHIGKFLRRTRLDELLQLFNIVKGDMSFVGVRPDIDTHFIYYNDLQKKEYIKNKPGIYGLAAYVYNNEGQILDKVEDKKDYYIKTLLPEKCKLNKVYNDNKCLKLDLKIILASFKFIKCITINDKSYEMIKINK